MEIPGQPVPLLLGGGLPDLPEPAPPHLVRDREALRRLLRLEGPNAGPDQARAHDRRDRQEDPSQGGYEDRSRLLHQYHPDDQAVDDAQPQGDSPAFRDQGEIAQHQEHDPEPAYQHSQDADRGHLLKLLVNHREGVGVDYCHPESQAYEQDGVEEDEIPESLHIVSLGFSPPPDHRPRG
ncbi:MAG TPA: hypothetical protein VF789_28700 [Thermoanaerobaculia bacterium]